MGQASKRGTFEERKAESIAKREERHRIDREAYLLRQAERDATLDRDYTPPCVTEPRQRSVGTGGFGSRGRSSSMMLMAAMLAATAGSIHPQALSDVRRV
jgi:hypothetical protein